VQEAKQERKMVGMGFGAVFEDVSALKEVPDLSAQDFVRFGMIPEFVGRFPVITELQQIDKDALVRIFSEPKNSIAKQYQALLKMSGVELSFDQEAIEAIADLALQRKTGARGLRGIVEKVMKPIMFEAPDLQDGSKVVITKECVLSGSKPKVRVV
jgi:ATP-dependent Clp protease ATP-binding subunit ClpX